MKAFSLMLTPGDVLGVWCLWKEGTGLLLWVRGVGCSALLPGTGSRGGPLGHLVPRAPRAQGCRRDANTGLSRGHHRLPGGKEDPPGQERPAAGEIQVRRLYLGTCSIPHCVPLSWGRGPKPTARMGTPPQPLARLQTSLSKFCTCLAPLSPRTGCGGVQGSSSCLTLLPSHPSLPASGADALASLRGAGDAAGQGECVRGLWGGMGERGGLGAERGHPWVPFCVPTLLSCRCTAASASWR